MLQNWMPAHPQPRDKTLVSGAAGGCTGGGLGYLMSEHLRQLTP